MCRDGRGGRELGKGGEPEGLGAGKFGRVQADSSVEAIRPEMGSVINYNTPAFHLGWRR